jgi:cytochrome c biogenesis protein CcdA
MLVLALVGLVAGVITSLSPCVLPVLPVVLTASVPSHTGVGSHSDVDDARDRVRSWRPYGVVAGLVLSFSVATLFGSLLLSALHPRICFARSGSLCWWSTGLPPFTPCSNNRRISA